MTTSPKTSSKMTDRLTEVWAELEGGPPETAGFTRRLLFPDSPARLFAAIRYPERSRMLLLQLPGEVVTFVAPDLPQMRGMRTRGVPSGWEAGTGYVALSLVESKLADLFDVLARDLVEELSSATSMEEQGHALVRRLDHWRTLFASYVGEELSLQARNGLFGELTWLRFMLESGVDGTRAVEMWQGSPGGDHDFVGADRAVEVKTTLAPGPVNVSSERQLDGSLYDQLFFAVVSTSIGSSGLTLPELVDGMRGLLVGVPETLVEFDRRLARVGYSPVHRERYENERYAPPRIRVYEVSEGFPRLTPADLPEGVSDVTYLLDLREQEPYPGGPEEVSSLFA